MIFEGVQRKLLIKQLKILCNSVNFDEIKYKYNKYEVT